MVNGKNRRILGTENRICDKIYSSVFHCKHFLITFSILSKYIYTKSHNYI